MGRGNLPMTRILQPHTQALVNGRGVRPVSSPSPWEAGDDRFCGLSVR
jgi:hypothetical protein